MNDLVGSAALEYKSRMPHAFAEILIALVLRYRFHM